MNRIPPTASTRFRPPSPVGRWLSRPRVNALLELAALRRLTLIHGPAGFGKSTLAAQWMVELAQRGARAVWFSLDADDDQTLWFLRHLLESLQRVHPGLDDTVFQILEERPEDAERHVVPLIINAVESEAERTVVVLDDWHVIEDARTRAVFARLLEDSGDRLAFIVTSRTTAGLPLASLHVHDQLVDVDPEVLRFDERESRQFLVDVKGLRLSGEELTELHTSTEGWIAALQLTSVSLKKNGDASVLLGNLALRQHSISDYLAENVLDLLEPRLRRFLLHTSVLTKINAELATLLTGEHDAEQLLRQALFGDLFLQRLDDTGVWFRYHHLFADFLLQRLTRDDPGLVAELHSLAAHWYHDHAMISLAVDHAMLAGEESFAVDIVEGQSLRMVEHSQMATLLALVSKLPEERICTRSWLQLAIAWAYCLLHFPAEAFASLDLLAEAAKNDESLTAAERFRIARESLVVRECVGMYRDRVADDERLREEVLAHAERLHPWTVSVAANVVTYYEIHRGRGAEALSLQRWAEAHHHQVVGSFSETYGECFAGLIAFHNLDVALAQHHWESAFRTACERSGRQSHAAKLALGLVGKLLYNRGDVGRAETMFDEALQLGQRAGVVDFMVPVYESLACIRLLADDREGALAVLDKGEQAGHELSLVRLWSRMVAFKVRCGLEPKRPELPADASDRDATYLRQELVRFDLSRLLQGRADPEPSVGAAQAGEVEGGSVPEEGSSDLAEAVAALRPRVEQMIAEVRDLGNQFQVLRDLILFAAVLEKVGAHQEAEETLREVLPDCEASGLAQPLIDGGEAVMSIMSRLVAEPDRWHPRRRSLEWLERLLAAATARSGASAALSRSGTGGETSPEAGRGGIVSDGTGSDTGLAGDGADFAGLTPRPVSLSEREQEILHLVDAGYTNREIAERLFIGRNTVKWYLRKLYRSLGVSTRSDCVRRAKMINVLP